MPLSASAVRLSYHIDSPIASPHCPLAPPLLPCCCPPPPPLAADVGDFWASYLKFETQFGGPELQEAVVKRFLAAEPRHGEHWQRVAKDPASAHQKPEVVLRKVMADLDKADL